MDTDNSQTPVALVVERAGPKSPACLGVPEAGPLGPAADDREGREMLYSSGTTGRPKGVRKQLPGTAFGDPSAVPVQVAPRGYGSPGHTRI